MPDMQDKVLILKKKEKSVAGQFAAGHNQGCYLRQISAG